MRRLKQRFIEELKFTRRHFVDIVLTPILIGLLVFVLLTSRNCKASTPQKIAEGIQKETCYIVGIVEHQKSVLHHYADQGSNFTAEDILRIRLAESTIASEQKRYSKFETKYQEITGRPLGWSYCGAKK